MNTGAQNDLTALLNYQRQRTKCDIHYRAGPIVIIGFWFVYELIYKPSDMKGSRDYTTDTFGEQ
jgi:hypothetical protein